MKIIAPQDLPLLTLLAQLSPQSSKNTLRSWVKEGRVLVNQAPVKNASVMVLKDQEVSVGQRKKIVKSRNIPILYEDSDFVIINKPSGLLSVATAFEKQETAYALLKAHYSPRKVFVVHRLDQETSGVMIFAFSEEICERLKALFEVHDIERSYTAIVEGELETSKGTWQSYQYEDEQYRVHDTKDEESGRLAITHYEVLGSSRRYSWLKVRLETGRKNQIRVHCEQAGCSVVGDKKYGARTNPLKRLCLHAHLLAFTHPITRKKMRFESPVPTEFYRLVPSMFPVHKE